MGALTLVRSPLILSKAYYEKVLSIRAGNRVAYWPLWEPSGGVAYDIGGRGFNGAHTGVNLGQAGIGDGKTSPYYDGTSDYTNVYSAGLAAAFNCDEGTMAIWAKMNGAGAWTDGTTPFIFYLFADADNRITIYKNAVSSLQWFYRSGGTTKTVTQSSMSTLDWMSLIITWSASGDAMRGYLNGAQVGATQTGLGTWVGALASSQTVIGAQSTVPITVVNGWLAHCVLFNTPLNPTEIAQLARVR